MDWGSLHTGESTGTGKDLLITGVRLRRRRFDVGSQYVEDLLDALHRLRDFAAGAHYVGPYFLKDQLRSKMAFACWVNPGRRAQLRSQFDRMPWRVIEDRARSCGLIVSRPRTQAA